MKRWMTSISAALLGLSLATGSLAAPATAPAKPGVQGQRRGGGPVKRFEAALAKLNLTPDQKTKVDKLMADTKAQALKVRQGAGTPEEKRTKSRELMKGFRAKLNAILTPEQEAKLKEAMPKRPGGQKNAKAKPASS